MKNFLINIRQPLSSIQENGWQFGVWLLVTILFGLAGFWMPLVFLWSLDHISNLIIITFAPFGIIILADGIAAAFVAKNTGSNPTAAGIRGVVGILAVALVLIQALVFASSQVDAFSITQPNTSARIPVYLHVVVVLVAILIACYLYCFRYPAWEKSVAEVPKEEEKEVTELSRKASIQDSDSEGIKL